MTMKQTTWLSGFLLAAVTACGASSLRAVGCAPSVEAAIAKLIAQEQATGETGYRVSSVRVDTLRGHRWAMVMSCSAPAAPMVAVELPGAITMSDAIILTHISMGESVKIVNTSADSRLQLSGVAIESAALGESIRVSLPRFGEDSSQPAPVIRCRVIGPGVVEVAR